MSARCPPSLPRPARRASSPVRAALLLALATLLPGTLVTETAQAARETAAAGIQLTEGATYRARLRPSFFQCLASEARIIRHFAAGGFTQVRVFMSPRELPSDWPAQYRSKAGSCARYAEGVWARPTTERRRPSSIESWWAVPRNSAPRP
jgi:hypothetical protein